VEVVVASLGEARSGTTARLASAVLMNGTRLGMILNTILQLLWILNAVAMLFVLILSAGLINELIKVVEKYNQYLDKSWWTK
jgi:hypothetical protein